MGIKKLKKSLVDLNLKTKKNKYVLDTTPEDPKLLPYLCFVGVEGVVKLMLVWLWSNTLKKWVYHQNFFNLPNQNIQWHLLKSENIG